MSSDVLLLNRNFYAIHIADWKRVMTLLYRGHASVLDEDFRKYNFDEWKDLSQMIENSPNGFIRTVSFKIAIPEVAVLEYYDELPDSEVKFTRKNLYSHYEHKCCYCGKKYNVKDLNLDHVVPRAQGGQTNWENIVLSCFPCNIKKGSRTPAEAHLTMHYKPNKPSWRPSVLLGVKTGLRVKMSWKKFIDELYWNTELEKENSL